MYVLPIADDSEMRAHSKPLPAEWEQSTDTSQDARHEYFHTEKQEEPEVPDDEEGAAPQASIEDFMQMELKEGPAMKSPDQKRGRYNRQGKPLLYCSFCPFTTYYPRSLIEHEKFHTRKCFKCNQCPERFAREYQLHKHMFIHTGKKPFKCDKCLYSTFMKHLLEKHYQLEHQEVKVVFVE